MVQICEDVHIPASASVLIAATCLEIKWGLNLVHSLAFFSFRCFFSQWFHFTLIWWTRFFHLLRLSCTVSWKPDGSFANISLACCSLHLSKWIQLYCFMHWKNRVEYRPAHSWVELGYTLLQRGCGKRSDLQVANCILQPFTILLDLVRDDDDSGD